MKYQYYICDVFTDEQFGGNPLAVVPEATGLSSEVMQKIAREFNFSETTFVLPASRGSTRQVRIFTPTQEVPFAGHPNIGTAFTLATIGEVAVNTTVIFEEEAGQVPVTIRKDSDEVITCELRAPKKLFVGRTFRAETIAEVLSLEVSDIVTENHDPKEASVGLPFLIVEVHDRNALGRAHINLDKLNALAAAGGVVDIHLYCRGSDESEIQARMFAPLDGVPEDPATGSANCALAGVLTDISPRNDGDFDWTVAQGVEMGRPSRLHARSRKDDGKVTDVWIGGKSVMFGEGWLHLA